MNSHLTIKQIGICNDEYDSHRSAIVAQTFANSLPKERPGRGSGRTNVDNIRFVRWLFKEGKTVDEIKQLTGLTRIVIKTIQNDVMPVFVACSPVRCPGCRNKIEVTPCPICEVVGIVQGDE